MRALLAGLLLLSACQAGPHGPEQLEIVAVEGEAEEGAPQVYRLVARAELAAAGDWEVWLPLPGNDLYQRVESLMIESGPSVQAEVTGGEDRLLHATGVGPLAVSWRGRVDRVPRQELVLPDLPAAFGLVEPVEPLAEWALALTAAGVPARLAHGLELVDGLPVACRWVEVLAEASWVAVEPTPDRVGLAASRIRLGSVTPRALHGGESAELAVGYELVRE